MNLFFCVPFFNAIIQNISDLLPRDAAANLFVMYVGDLSLSAGPGREFLQQGDRLENFGTNNFLEKCNFI